MEPLISIIIPVYNVEKYFEDCMQSVFAQDYKKLEIILVDDGATDSSGDMCDDFAKKDNRIKVIHKKNEGLSSARNSGIQVMTGDYLTFIDSDDYIRSDYISKLLGYIINDESDLVICSCKKVLCKEDFTRIPNNSIEHHIFDCDAIKYMMVSRQVPMYAHGKLFRADHAIKLKFPFGKLYEDVPTIWNVVKYAYKVTYATDEIYFYRQRADSIVNSRYKHDRMDQVYFAEEIYYEVDKYSSLGLAAGSRCFFAATDNFTFVSKEYPDDKRYLKNVIKQHRIEVLKDESAEINLKIMAMISFINIDLLRLLGKLYKKKNYKKWTNAKGYVLIEEE